MSKRHELCHEEDTLWKRGNMPDDVEMAMVSHENDARVASRPSGPARMGLRSDLLSDRRVAITAEMKKYDCKRPKGSKDAQEIRYRRAIAKLQCAT